MKLKNIQYYKFCLNKDFIGTLIDTKHKLNYILLKTSNIYFSFIFTGLIHIFPSSTSILLLSLYKFKPYINTFINILNKYNLNKYKFSLKLEIIGIGYKSILIKNNYLIFILGYSHFIKIKIPQKLILRVLNNGKLIEAVHEDKYILGNIIHILKRFKPIEVYKGKGIKNIYQNIQLKLGKTKTLKK